MMLAVASLAATLLAPCPSQPNCVSTLATDSIHAIEPLRYAASAAEAYARLLAILHSMPRTRVVSSDGATIHAEFRSAVFHFVDDGVFVIDDTTRSIHFRSASRVGRSDFGVNRKRMESIRTAFQLR